MIDAPMSRTNYLLGAVNWKVPIESLDIRSEDERQQYFVFLEEAERHMEEYGFWPTFEMGEIEYDDPVLDFY